MAVLSPVCSHLCYTGLSNHGRYTGLLDVLDFKEGGASELPDALQVFVGMEVMQCMLC